MTIRLAALLALGASLAPVMALAQDTDAAARAAATEKQMTDEERGQLVLGHLFSNIDKLAVPEGVKAGAGVIVGIPRLGVPTLRETDASLGVTWVGGARGNGGTQLPSGTAQGSTWNPELIERGGRMIGGEARAKGYNVMLAGGINLMREPRNGRTFEYISEDPLLAGTLGGAAVRGIQSNGVISTLKHYAINPQETGRAFMNVMIDEGSLRESDLLAFEIAIEQGEPGSIMCAYNKLNGPQSCSSQFLLTGVLRRDWGYRGFTMSDWGAVDATDYALAGLDQQSGSQIDPQQYFGTSLLDAAKNDPAYKKHLGEMARRVLWAIYDNGLDKPAAALAIDPAANAEVSLEVARQGIVLLRNERGILPLGAATKSIAVIGGHADAGTIVGGGSSKVLGDDGPSASLPGLRDGTGPFAWMLDRDFNRSPPLAAIRAAAPDATVRFREGRYASDAELAAKAADVAIVFVTQYMTEGFDVPDLSLPDGQDALITAVAAANPNTIVVLQTGGPVAMPWKDQVAGIVEAWYPGARGGEAIAEVLFGTVNPSGHLPISFPASESQLPRPKLDGLDTVEPNFIGVGTPGQTLDVNYDIEGSDIGYRWFARQGTAPLYPFGHGLSYTTFDHRDLTLTRGKNGALTAGFTIANTGARAGADVAQLYLVSVNGQRQQRLVGFARHELQPGASVQANVAIDPRLLAEWDSGGWRAAAGTYAFALGHSAADLGPPVNIKLDGYRLDARGKRAR
jgi:beta-glucosidase